MVCFLLLSLTDMAQTALSRCDVGVSVGAMNYVGDLNGQRIDGRLNVAAGLVGRYNLDDRWAVSLGVNYGRLEGGNPDVIRTRNLSFRSHLLEGALRIEFNFVPFGTSPYVYRTTPYLFVGMGIFHFNPKAHYTDPVDGSSRWVELQPLHTEGQGSDQYPDRDPYSLLQLSIPFGFGFKMALTSDIVLAVEYGFRMTWTDYLDDVSTTYVSEALLGPGSMAASMADRSTEIEGGQPNPAGGQRGDDSLNDAFAYINLSVTFNMEMLFGWIRGKRCPK